jgi:hypothetical protein
LRRCHDLIVHVRARCYELESSSAGFDPLKQAVEVGAREGPFDRHWSQEQPLVDRLERVEIASRLNSDKKPD